ncbi:XdhC family protein [Tepidibacter hydrothermalis]|uniref:XdhC/CoxI family protein n=1 Tax=Tepidibacter hydrothermalis TaxID=3036126 RepID=A0ABY8EDN6_9FIRM|nr:XdhC/CoxI family protein [Tepidibacter hydrothermalis]WFD09694.1 XdhC/CoxI family protein [Tepidibacter hydrothermalis]
MEYKILNQISDEIKLNKKVALATITRVEGSTPRKEGSMMGIKEDGTIFGTIGGGTLELVVMEKAKKCIINGESKNFNFKLTDDEGSLHMQCGGEADVFIKVFKPFDKLFIVGGGHIAFELYELGKMLEFHTTIVEDREEFCNINRFPQADELKLGDIQEILQEYPIDDSTYVVIVTRGHKHDEVALKSVIDSNAKYIGMIGSKNKTKYIMDNLKSEKVSQEKLDKIYAPIGIDLGGQTPKEIAFSIMSEILVVKNNGSLNHLKDIKK